MKSPSRDDIAKTVLQLRRCADRLEKDGPLALRHAQDWATPLRSSGTDPGRGKGEVSDPTYNAAFGNDPNAEQLTFLGVELGQCFDASVSLESRIARLSSVAVAENQRAGIGYCADPNCNRYCDGTASNRLRNLICPSCDAKERRARKEPEACDHKKKRRWSDGKWFCEGEGCGVELTEAGVPVLSEAVGQ